MFEYFKKRKELREIQRGKRLLNNAKWYIFFVHDCGYDTWEIPKYSFCPYCGTYGSWKAHRELKALDTGKIRNPKWVVLVSEPINEATFHRIATEINTSGYSGE